MWIFVTSMTVARTGYGVALLQDKIYVVGGKIENTYDRTMEAYDLENDRWIPKASMKNPNAFFGVRDIYF